MPEPAWRPRRSATHDPELQPAPGGSVHELTMHAVETEIEVAPGVTQMMWTFDGTVPGTTLRGKVGDVFTITLVNDGQIGHSIDFHASKVAWNDEMRTIEPGESLVYQFEAKYAGAFMYHCGTQPTLHHIGNGMFGAIIIDPPGLPPVDHEYLFVQSELYLGPQAQPGDLAKMQDEAWDAVVFNGYVNQYRHAPIRVEPGERARAWVVDDGPSENSSFHVGRSLTSGPSTLGCRALGADDLPMAVIVERTESHVVGTGRGDRAGPPAVVQRIIVPVDGSPFAERAMPVAAWASRSAGAPIHLLDVVAHPTGTASAVHYLHELARRYPVASWDVTSGGDPGPAISAATGADPRRLVCLATRGRDRTAAVLGSVASAVLDRIAQPVMLVGPEARPPCAGDAPVVVAVDGADHAEDGALLRIALGWAAMLGTRVVVATVAEPAPGSVHEGRLSHRARGPVDPEGYVAGLAAEAPAAAPIDTRVVHDPVSVRDALVRMVDRTAALLVIGSHRRTRPLRALFGSHAARVVHDIAVPALVVPLDHGGGQHAHAASW